MEVDDGADGIGAIPPAGMPLAVAVLRAAPAVSSAAVTVYRPAAAQVSYAPEASDGCGHVTGPALGSLTASRSIVSAPVLVTVNV